MAKVLESYMYGNPEDILDRKRATDAARAKRKAERAAERSQRSSLAEEELKLIPADWMHRK
jgi:hypothetical protein